MSVGIGLKIDSSDLVVIQNKMAKFLSGFKDKKPILDKVGFILENSARGRIESTKDKPDGSKWKDWSKDYAKTRHENQSLLMSTGHMLSSISYRVFKDKTVVGSRMPYSAFIQDGTKKMVSREFLGMSNEDARNIINAITAWAEKMRDQP